ncbi:hypothetical protein EV426DRAFT_46452 [Tirmania nivea]|nr:hypothetical protein EV426DRAFT_46452 [Tirmania nivea]
MCGTGLDSMDWMISRLYAHKKNRYRRYMTIDQRFITTNFPRDYYYRVFVDFLLLLLLLLMSFHAFTRYDFNLYLSFCFLIFLLVDPGKDIGFWPWTGLVSWDGWDGLVSDLDGWRNGQGLRIYSQLFSYPNSLIPTIVLCSFIPYFYISGP